jgi:hypothetical protein
MSLNSFEVSSYLKDREGRDVEIAQWSARVPDENYVEGWIALSVDGHVLLNESHWDLVDQLWAYLIDGISESLNSGRAFECFFPDQPLKLRIQPMSWDELVFTVGEHSTRTSKTSFVKAIATGGREFFRRIKSFIPSGNVTWDSYIGKCEMLLQRTETAGQ